MYYLNFSSFTVFLKNRNISSKIKRSKVTDYAALKRQPDNNIRKCLFFLFNISTDANNVDPNQTAPIGAV